MIEQLKEIMSRLMPISTHKAKLNLYETMERANQRARLRRHLFFKIWLIVTTAISFWEVLRLIWSQINGQKESLDMQPTILMMVGLGFSVLIHALWKYLHGKNSPIERWQLANLLWRFSETASLLNSDKGNSKKSIRWEYITTFPEVTLVLLAGGSLSSEIEHDISRRLVAFLAKETTNYWELVNTGNQNGVITIRLTHLRDKRIIIDDLAKLRRSEQVNIQLTHKLSWTARQQMGEIVGPTGSGKTSLLKSIIISFLVNDKNNRVYTIDGKAAFLGQSMKRLGNVATNPAEAVQLTDKLCQIMAERYQELNSDVNDERDITYAEKFHNGSVLLVVDEILALITNMQASDRQISPSERLYPRFNANLLSLINKGRQSSISVVVSGQMIPATILPTEARISLGMRISLGSTSPQQAQEVFGVSSRELPSVDVANYGGLIWLDGLNWDGPRAFLPSRYDDQKLPFKATLSKLAEGRRGGGGTPQATAKSKDLPVT
ncbi:MAG: FtsK/SpoIIIE domain-containing protein [Oenococcus sp.]|uniref:FtsK/SpoIIIE domain-containing protein n=1 Tax=Oenococcus sp. TaxID=1979414 RepID=UPI0039EC7C91